MMKNKALGSFLCLAAAVVALITAIVFLTTQADAAPLGHAGAMPGIVLLAGVVAAVVLFLSPVHFGALIQAGVYAYALYLVVVQLYFVFADVINNVTYAGGNPMLCVLYMAGTLLACLLCVAACFLPQTRGEEKGLDVKQLATVGAAVAAVLVVCLVGSVTQNGSGTAGSGSAGSTGPAGSSGSESSGSSAFRFDYKDNTYVGKTVEELAAIDWNTWIAKEQNGEVAYFFEGQYTEGFATILDPACLDIYCCKDGSMYGTFSGPTTSVAGGGIAHVFGYWYNYDESGEYNFVIHLTGTQDVGGMPVATNVGAGADDDIYIFDTNHGAYSWEASLSYGLWGGMMTRNINIYGQEYAKAQSLRIDTADLETFYTGDSFSPNNLKVTAVRANGSEETIWGGRLFYSGYESDAAGAKTVTASFLGASATLEAKVEPLVTETFAGKADLPVGGAVANVDVLLTVDYSHMKVTMMASDFSGMVSGTLLNAGDKGLTMILNGSDPLETPFSTVDGVKTISIPAHQQKVGGWGPPTIYDIGACELSAAS